MEGNNDQDEAVSTDQFDRWRQYYIERTEHPKAIEAAKVCRGIGDAYRAIGDADDCDNTLDSYEKAIKIYEAHNPKFADYVREHEHSI
jgi:ubiquinone/menaquinone biosynthesis C-methylase UbiE